MRWLIFAFPIDCSFPKRARLLVGLFAFLQIPPSWPLDTVWDIFYVVEDIDSFDGLNVARNRTTGCFANCGQHWPARVFITDRSDGR